MWTLPLAFSLLAANVLTLPPVDVQLQSGARVNLAGWRGHPVVVVFWATWCEPCRQELAALERLSAHPAAQHKILAIAIDSQGWKTVLPFIREHSYKLPVTLLTPALARGFGFVPSKATTPLTLFFDRGGRICSRHDVSLPLERLAGLIASLVAAQD